MLLATALITLLLTHGCSAYKAEYCQQDVCEYGVRLNDYIKINMLPEFDVDESKIAPPLFGLPDCNKSKEIFSISRYVSNLVVQPQEIKPEVCFVVFYLKNGEFNYTLALRRQPTDKNPDKRITIPPFVDVDRTNHLQPTNILVFLSPVNEIRSICQDKNRNVVENCRVPVVSYCDRDGICVLGTQDRKRYKVYGVANRLPYTMKLTGTDAAKTMTIRVFNKDAPPPVTEPTDVTQGSNNELSPLNDISTTSASGQNVLFSSIVLYAFIMQF